MPAASLLAWYASFPELRERALGQLDELFTADITYRDPFRETRGMPAFRELFVRMFARYPEVRFSGFLAEGDERAFTLTYDMHLRMKVGPTFTTPMASVCTVRDGKVATLADYYDFASGLVSPSRRAARAYRRMVMGLFL